MISMHLWRRGWDSNKPSTNTGKGLASIFSVPSTT